MSVAINSSPAGALGNQSSCRKRKGSDDESDRQGDLKRTRYSWYVTLESESSDPTDEDEESIYTVQGNETEYVRDTSDTSTTHTWISSSKSDVSFHVEYELDSRSENDNPFMSLSSSSEPENILAVEFITFCDSEGLADNSDASRSSIDSEIRKADFRICVQCKNLNSNPLFPYCERCYQVRKTHFPRNRPRRKPRIHKNQGKSVFRTASTLSSTQELCEMDSGIASSQDLDRHLFGSQGSEITAFDSQSSQLTTATSDSLYTETCSSSTISMLTTTTSDSLYTETRRSSTISMNASQSLDKDEVDSGLPSSNYHSTDHTHSSDISSELNSTKDRTDESRNEPISNSTMNSLSPAIVTGKNSLSGKEENGNVVTSIPKTQSEQQIQGSDSLCPICIVNPKNGVFVHGHTAHIYCCYRCAKKVWTTNDHRCPICNRKVTQILKAFHD